MDKYLRALFFSNRNGPLGWALLILVGLLLSGHSGRAQTVDTYTFAPSTSPFVPLPATATAVSSIQADDALSASLPLGFSFIFDGTPFTSCSVSSNGWLSFNPAAAGNSLTNDLATGTASERPRVAPFWDDLNGSTGSASYLTTGTAPNRVFTFEWLNWYRYTNTGPSFSMQVQLLEGSNVVRFVYRQEANPLSGASVSIGLSGVGSGLNSFLSLSDATASPTASTSTETNSVSTLPATNQCYTFTPPPPAACPTPRNLAATALTATSSQVSWTVLTGSGPFTVQYGPTGFNPALPSSATNAYAVVSAATGNSTTLSGLTASTGYQFYITQNCGGTNGNSNRSTAGTFQTACITPLYASLPVTEGFENAWISRCDTRDVPTNNWRNAPATGNGSWRRDDDGTAGAWANTGSYAYAPTSSQGAHSARFHSGQALNGTIGTLDLFVNLSAVGAKRLSFDYINTSGVDSLLIQLSTNGGATFSRLAGYSLSGTASTGFVTQVLPISSTSATSVIRFRGRADYGTSDIGLDNIVLESATGCLTPASLTATTTTTTASLSWLTGGTGTYTVLHGPTGFNPALPSSATNVYTTASGLAGPPFSITGLAPATTYQFYVTLNCSGTTNSGTAGPVAFTTQITNDEPCTATLLPVNNTCTSVSGTTVGATTTTPVGYTNAGTCAGSNTTPLDVWFRFTTAATGPTSTQVRIGVTGGSAEIVRGFSGAICSGSLTSLGCSGTGSGTAAPNLDLLNLTPSTTYFVRVSNYSSFQPVLGPFTICATPVPNCPAPAGLATGTLTNTTANVSWSAVSSGTGSTYTVIYGPTGFSPPGSGTSVTGITGTSTTLTGLTANTAYQFYVRQICGGFNGSSVLTGPFSFATTLAAPANDEPCGAITLTGNTISGSNVGATTSFQNGINLPACSSAQAPKDVWFAFTATGTTKSLAVTGTAAGLVRVFTSPDCVAGPFAMVFCQAGASNNQNAGALNITGLTAGTRYYLAVSGYGSSDTTGPFAVLAAKTQAETNALLVFPNPSATGQLTLRLSGPGLAGAGQASLLNALGQVVLIKALNGTAEQVLSTRNLAAGLYTLRVAVAGQILTRKVVLE